MKKYLCFLIFSFAAANFSILEGVVASNEVNSKLSNKFVLITSLYNETNLQRIEEYIICFEKNLLHEDIEKFVVFYDTSKDNQGELVILDYLKGTKAIIFYISERPTFDDCFNIANQYYPDRRIIICNADIYFDDTLQLLRDYSLNNSLLALTRWDVLNNNKEELHPNEYSQDVWIFQAPIKKIECDDIQLGTMFCDNTLSLRIEQSGLEIRNPCLSIKCHHLHMSGFHNDRTPHLWLTTHNVMPKEIDIMKLPFEELSTTY